MRSLWVAVTRRALARGRRESFGAGLSWGALTCFMVAVLTVHVSMWWYGRGRSPVQQPTKERPRAMLCAEIK